MGYRMQILPSAEEVYRRILAEKRKPLSAQLPKWLRKLTKAASRGISIADLPGLPMGEVIETLIDESPPPGDRRCHWRRARAEFERAGLLDKLRAAWATVRTGRPPWEFLVVQREFRALDGDVRVLIEVKYRVIHGEKLVIFDDIQEYTPPKPGGRRGRD
ncbi:MAG: hypothetical protein BGO49_05650 [Planctomycetales bacterium 71-10]|nr:MAG: hypothetical protein BGO49_05650 [Planctomycetales bacterium 71-10]